jgi:lipopolysaccharide transport system permease protein
MSLAQYFRLVDTMARMALRADASRYFLGYIWWVLEPLLFVGVFYVVFNIILESGRADFLVFLMCGKLTFIWFSKSVNQAANSIVSSRGLIGRINVTKTLFPLAVIQESLYRQAAVFLLLFGVLFAWGYSPTLTWLSLLPVIFVNYLMIVACAYIGACLVCMLRDFSMIITLGMTFLLFTSGIFWDVRALDNPQMTELVLAVNPLAFILDAYRQILMFQTQPDWIHLLQIGCGSVVLLALVVLVMRRNSQYLALKALS